MEHEEHSTQWKDNPPSKLNYVLSTGVALLGILFFLLFLLMVYLPNKPRPVDDFTEIQRKEALEKLRADQHSVYEAYAVIDKEKGIVQIPVDRAMQVVVDSFREDATNKQPWETSQ